MKKHDWKIGDSWKYGKDIYLLSITSSPPKNKKYPNNVSLYIQFINKNTGNLWSYEVIDPKKLSNWDGETVPVEEIYKLIFEKNINKGTFSDLDILERQHVYGERWNILERLQKLEASYSKWRKECKEELHKWPMLLFRLPDTSFEHWDELNLLRNLAKK
jgi:hypothetical protein